MIHTKTHRIVFTLTLLLACVALLLIGWALFRSIQTNTPLINVITGTKQNNTATPAANKRYTMRHKIYDQSAIAAKKYTKTSLSALAQGGSSRSIHTNSNCQHEWRKQRKSGIINQYFCWPSADSGKTWLAQGITGSGSARSSLDGGNKNILLISWYTKSKVTTSASGSDDANRLTVINMKTKKYRHVELAKPCSTGIRMCRLGSHAGGIAWAGNYLYVASTVGLYMFDLRDIKIVNGRAIMAAKEAYVLNYSTKGGELTARLGTVSFDTTKNQLVTGEFRQHGDKLPPQVMRWSLNEQRQLGRGSTIPTASSFTSNVEHMQGVASYNGKYVFFSSSTKVAGRNGYGGALIAWRPGQKAKAFMMPWHVESAYIDATNKRVWGLTEYGPHEDTGYIFSLPGSSVL